MSSNKLASKLLQFTNTTSLVVPGAITADIGGEAVQDALNRGWIRPDTETGFLRLTDQQSQLITMRELAESPELEAPQPVPESAGRAFALRHSTRFQETLGLGGDTSGSGGAPGGGQPQLPSAPPTNQTPTSQTPNKPGQDYTVGSDVLIASEGKSYQAKVQKAFPDGTYQLTFGPNRPPQAERMFRREELQKIQPERDGTVKIQQRSLTGMKVHSQAESLARALLEVENPKHFLKHVLPGLVPKNTVEYSWDVMGIDNAQFFQGCGVSYSRWDAVYVGTGDNAAEAADDALDSATQDGWEVDEPANEAKLWPTRSSVSGYLTAKAKSQAEGAIDRDDFEDEQDYTAAINNYIEHYLEAGDSELYYYVALYLRKPRKDESTLPNAQQEAENPKAFLKSLSQTTEPPTWPHISRWRSAKSNRNLEQRRAFHYKTHNILRRNPGRSIALDDEGNPIYDPQRLKHNLRNTYFQRDRIERRHRVMFHNTVILEWDSQGNVCVNCARWRTPTTRKRINQFIPHGWIITTYRYTWYWFNSNWPDNIRKRLWGDQTAQRKPIFPWWIEYHDSDTIENNGTLIYGCDRNLPNKSGRAYPNGSLKTESDTEVRPVPQGDLTPPRRARQVNPGPNQAPLQIEGKYFRQLAHWKRIKAKHERIKEVSKLERELKSIDKPNNKKKPKKGHQHLR